MDFSNTSGKKVGWRFLHVLGATKKLGKDSFPGIFIRVFIGAN